MADLTPAQSDAAAQRDADIAGLAALQDKLYTVIMGSIDRTRAAATVVQTAATAIAGLYTGVLGFLFAADAQTIPLRAILAPVFLGAAIVLSAAYTSYLTNVSATTALEEASGPEGVLFARLQFFVGYVKGITEPRSSLMRAAVVSLGVALAMLPLPFIAPPGGANVLHVEPWGSLVVLLIGAAAVTIAARFKPKG